MLQVRKDNYNRRTDQINNQGFVSLKQEPYKAVGHPVYLDTKSLITDTLGLPLAVSRIQLENRNINKTYIKCLPILPHQEEEQIGERPTTPTGSDQQNQQVNNNNQNVIRFVM